jgi:hypothetical protein
MRKFILATSIATVSLMVTACGNTDNMKKDEAVTVDTTEATAPVASANSAAANPDRGGDPGARPAAQAPAQTEAQ